MKSSETKADLKNFFTFCQQISFGNFHQPWNHVWSGHYMKEIMDLYLLGEIYSWTPKVVDIFWSHILQSTFKKKKYDTFKHLQLAYSSSNILKAECL